MCGWGWPTAGGGQGDSVQVNKYMRKTTYVQLARSCCCCRTVHTYLTVRSEQESTFLFVFFFHPWAVVIPSYCLLFTCMPAIRWVITFCVQCITRNRQRRQSSTIIYKYLEYKCAKCLQVLPKLWYTFVAWNYCLYFTRSAILIKTNFHTRESVLWLGYHHFEIIETGCRKYGWLWVKLDRQLQFIYYYAIVK